MPPDIYAVICKLSISVVSIFTCLFTETFSGLLRLSLSFVGSVRVSNVSATEISLIRLKFHCVFEQPMVPG